MQGVHSSECTGETKTEILTQDFLSTSLPDASASAKHLREGMTVVVLFLDGVWYPGAGVPRYLAAAAPVRLNPLTL
eukprot:1182818-Rhodomonas_salina.6